MATPKVKYNRSYIESVLWLLVLFLLLLLFIVPFRSLLSQAEWLSVFYAENEERSMKCRIFLEGEIKGTEGGLNSNTQYKLSLGELYFNEMFPNDRRDALTGNRPPDCDVE